MTRVQIPSYQEAWMRGDRYGEIVRVIKDTGFKGEKIEIVHVRLDKSGELERCILDHCEVL